jgi:hypothetical protein
MFVGVRPSENSASEPGAVLASVNAVSEDYFKTLEIPLLRGRSFLPSETAAVSENTGRPPRRIAIVDKLAAERLWPTSDAVGRHLNFRSNDVEIVGVVGPVQEQIIGDTTVPPHLYIPFGQEYEADAQIHLRVAAQGPEAEALMLEAVRREIQATDDRLPVLALKTLRDHVNGSLDVWLVRTGAQMLGVFGAIAMLLAVIGLYGVKAYAVARRTREIGIRMAIGASSGDVLRMIVSEAILVTAVGVGAGLVLALALGRVLAGILYDVRSVDVAVLSIAVLLLTAVSMLAGYLPALKAARVNPIVALRYD